MDDNPLASPTQLLLAVLGGNLQLFITSASPYLAFALQIFSLTSLALIIVVNWRKIFPKPNEKPTTDD